MSEIPLSVCVSVTAGSFMHIHVRETTFCLCIGYCRFIYAHSWQRNHFLSVYRLLQVHSCTLMAEKPLSVCVSVTAGSFMHIHVRETTFCLCIGYCRFIHAHSWQRNHFSCQCIVYCKIVTEKTLLLSVMFTAHQALSQK